MATNFPVSFDSYTDKVDDVDDAVASHINDPQSAIVALETKVGITGVGFNPASSSAPASLVLHEDTDNGTNKITVKAPDTIASDKVLTLPDETGTIATQEKLLYGMARQAIINGNFVINQRAYVSNAVLAAGAYGHDRWKAGVSGGDYTFTQLPSSTQITIKTGKSLIQVIEDKNVKGGTYTLSWTGTAQARFGKDSATPSGAYASSPVTITGQAAGTVMSVEFNEGTLGTIIVNSGDVALPFQPKSFEEELRACQRYYQRYITPPLRGVMIGTTSASRMGMLFPVEMRIAPTPVMGGNIPVYDGSGTSTASAISNNYCTTTNIELDFTTGALTSLRPAVVYQTGTAYIEFTAEL